MTEQAVAGLDEQCGRSGARRRCGGVERGLVLARARRSVVVIDAGEPRNAPAAAVHGFLTRDGIAPAELVRTGRREVEGYGGRVLAGRASACPASPRAASPSSWPTAGCWPPDGCW